MCSSHAAKSAAAGTAAGAASVSRGLKVGWKPVLKNRDCLVEEFSAFRDREIIDPIILLVRDEGMKVSLEHLVGTFSKTIRLGVVGRRGTHIHLQKVSEL
jgi:hypothetical protein